MMPTSNENEMGKVKMYAVVDGEYREVIELQGEITLSECDEQLWQYDYVRVVRCKECRYAHMSTDGRVKYCEVWFPDEAEYLDGDNYCSCGERGREIV